MNYNRDKIINIISKIAIVDADDINAEDVLANIGIDSLKRVELAVLLEDELNIQFEYSDLDPSKLNCVKDILSLSEKYLLQGV